MITDLTNLGGSLRGTTDLGVSKAKDIGKSSNAQTGTPDKASSFDQILQNKVSSKPTEKVLKSDKDVRASYLQKEPASAKPTVDNTEAKPRTDKVEVSSSKNEPRTARENERSWEEPGSVKEEGQSEKVGTKSNSSSANREQVMLEFMDSMESEFGIPPQRIVEAMTMIPESDQLSSPEDSASQVIAQLELPTDEEQKALALYVGMLTQLQQTQKEPAMTAPMTSGKAASAVAAVAMAPVMLSSQQRRAALNSSLDQMNSKFFVDNKAVAPEMPTAKLGQLMPETTLPTDQFSFGNDAQMMKTGMTANPEILRQAPPMPNYGPGKLNMQELQMQQMDPNSAEAQALAKSLAGLSAAAVALDQGLKTDPKNMQALNAEQALGMNAPIDGATAGAGALGAAGVAAFGMGAGGNDSEEDAWGGESSQNSEFMVSQPHSQKADHAKANVDSISQSFGAAMAGMEAKQAGGAESEANIRQIMNQAQYLIKKGGGETKIQMAPEGIGQVHMKLAVMDGKVNLEMSAETNEAKKLLESSLSDLKSSLGQHNLTVDKVKVDVGNQLAGENRNNDSQQQQQRQMQDQARDQARNFWNEFQGGQDRRQAFIDSPGIRAYGGSHKVEPLTPTSSGAAAQKAYSGSGKGRGLNLVA